MMTVFARLFTGQQQHALRAISGASLLLLTVCGLIVQPTPASAAGRVAVYATAPMDYTCNDPSGNLCDPTNNGASGQQEVFVGQWGGVKETRTPVVNVICTSFPIGSDTQYVLIQDAYTTVRLVNTANAAQFVEYKSDGYERIRSQVAGCDSSSSGGTTVPIPIIEETIYGTVAYRTVPDPNCTASTGDAACTRRVLLYGSAGSAPRLAAIADYLAAAKFTTTTTTSFPTDEQLTATALLIIDVTAQDARERTVAEFVQRGGALLLIGEHGRFPRGAATVRAYAADFGLTITTDSALAGCRTTNQVQVTGGIPVTGDMTALVAGTATITGGTPVLQTTDGRTVLAVSEHVAGGVGRVAVAGDSNIFAGCAAFLEPNRRFAVALFDWLAEQG